MSDQPAMMADFDLAEVRNSLLTVAGSFPGQTLKLLEVGTGDGTAARFARDTLNGAGAAFSYWGVGLGREVCRVPFDGATMFWGDSCQAAPHVPDDLHWLLVNGCHCLRHAVLDMTILGPRLRRGGLLLMHETSPNIPVFHYYQGHGPQDRRESHVAVRQALTLMGLLPPGRRQDWTLLADVYHDRAPFGGFVTYERTE